MMLPFKIAIRQPGRNDPCWCKSGRKYKLCHLDRGKQPVITIQDQLSAVRKEYDKAKYCLHSDAEVGICGPIIKAHTIQQSRILESIAENGKVIDFEGHGAEILKRGRSTAKLTGIKDASTFTGFCELHDNETFKPIETLPFKGDNRQCFLLAYRAICHELYERRISVSLIPFFRTFDSGRPIENQIFIQKRVNQYEAWSSYRLVCTQHHKQQYDERLKEHDYTDENNYVINFAECPDLVCSAAYCPRFDFDGRILQSADTNRIFDIITCSVIATNNGGAAVFSWLGQSTACERFVRSLDKYPDEKLPQAIIRLLFYSFRDIYGRPTWWKNLGETAQKKLLRIRSIGMSPKHSLYPSAYKDDGLQTVDWKIVSRETNISLA